MAGEQNRKKNITEIFGLKYPCSKNKQKHTANTMTMTAHIWSQNKINKHTENWLNLNLDENLLK